MITNEQKNQACILLNKLKILVTQAATVYTFKDFYEKIEEGIASGGAGGAEGGDEEGESAGGPPSGGSHGPSGSGSAGGDAEEGGDAAGFTGISEDWYKEKITSLKTEIRGLLTKITAQIKNNI